MAEHCCVDKDGLAVHNRLDLKQTAREWSAPECGSINQITRKPDYCCFNCPTLKAKIKSGEEA